MGYPTSAASFTTKVNGAGNTIDASHINDLQTEIAALEAALVTSGLAHHLKFVHGTYDIGVSAAANAPRDGFFTRNVAIGGTLAVTGVATFTAAPVFSAGLGTTGTIVWTDGSGAALSFTSVSGSFVKVGGMVAFAGAVTYPSTVDGTDARIAGLPFAMSAAGGDYGAYMTYTTYATATIFDMSGTTLFPYHFGGVQPTNANLSLKILRFSGSYRTDA